ncbi:uncharacterized protein LOC117317719 [Pecten maximus]|uniref:uncharacterized protein LOC117317719 n=1 Tax=Pecten maximus TaxID=6579 RepID=UPI001457EB24|nr:uncharacterized protein LOC117317719 [Pecten maximus]
MGAKQSGPIQYPKLEHWSTYKINGIKGLEEHKKALAAEGLKDPWIRNEVWRFRKTAPTSKFGYLRILGYAAVCGTLLVVVRNNLVRRDSHNEPYIL